MVAGAAGAAVGVGIGVASSAVLNDEKTKKKIIKVVDVVKEQAQEYMEAVQDSDVLDKGRKAAKETMASATKVVQKKANEQIKNVRRKVGKVYNSKSSINSKSHRSASASR